MVLFLDSGIGGLPYCARFLARGTRRGVLYFADREQFPYGAKTREELRALLVSRVSLLLERFPLELAALVCNTASVSALDALRGRFPALPFVGTVPAIRPAMESSRTGVAGVLGTARTIDDPYIEDLAARYGKGRRLLKLAAPELVEFVERRLHSAGEAGRREAVRPWVERFRNAGADGIVLGCTHFLFLLDEFRAAARPDITVYDSVEGVISRVESLLPAEPERPDETAARILLVSGKAEDGGFWAARAAEYGMELRFLGRGNKP
jgi:glutamate racemase